MNLHITFLLFVSILIFLIQAAENENISYILQGAISQDFAMIEQALQNGEDVNTINDLGWSAAMIAVEGFDLDLLRFLIEQQIDLNIGDNNGLTPLMLAASRGDREMVEILLRGNANPLPLAVDGSSAYSIALQAGRKVVAMIIAEVAIIHAMHYEENALVRYYVEESGYFNVRNSAGWTPLIYFITREDYEYATSLIRNPLVVKGITDNDGWSALHHIAAKGNEDICNLLLSADINPSAVTVNGHSVIDIAREHGHDGIVKIVEKFIQSQVTQEL
eukprot:gene11473-15366_t